MPIRGRLRRRCEPVHKVLASDVEWCTLVLARNERETWAVLPLRVLIGLIVLGARCRRRGGRRRGRAGGAGDRQLGLPERRGAAQSAQRRGGARRGADPHRLRGRPAGSISTSSACSMRCATSASRPNRPTSRSCSTPATASRSPARTTCCRSTPRLERERDLLYEALPLNLVMGEVAQAQKLGLVILDACRDNPLAEQLRRTLGPIRSRLVGDWPRAGGEPAERHDDRLRHPARRGRGRRQRRAQPLYRRAAQAHRGARRRAQPSVPQGARHGAREHRLPAGAAHLRRARRGAVLLHRAQAQPAAGAAAPRCRSRCSTTPGRPRSASGGRWTRTTIR